MNTHGNISLASEEVVLTSPGMVADSVLAGREVLARCEFVSGSR
jgi:hypothetical protein